MKYTSLREYFYKLNNLLFVIILVPLLIFVALYWQIQQGNLDGIFYDEQEITELFTLVAGVILVCDWIFSLILFDRGLKAAFKLQSLGARLDRYYSLSITRFLLIMSGSILLSICFFATGDQMFTILVILNMLCLMLLWPRAGKVCNDLKLKGDEYTLVFHKKDRL